MLSGPTLWIVFVINFFALGIVWTYVARSYPDFHAARFWAAATFIGAASAAFARVSLSQWPDDLTPLLVSGTFLTFATCLTAMGIQRFYGRTVTWPASLLITVLTAAGMATFIVLHDSRPLRILAYSIGQSVPIAMTLPLLFSNQSVRINSGARLAGTVGILIVTVYAIRSTGVLLNVGNVSFTEFGAVQALMLLVLVFLTMMWNCGFLLMAIDRLRNEVADLALVDDLTGAANRRRMVARLEEECVRSDRTQQPFAILMIDLDSFKDINDRYGHAAGDECLKTFTQAVQSRLRTGDLLARMGGDEFCVVLPSTTLREAAVVARTVVEACREQYAMWRGVPIMMSASIGIAQWRKETGLKPKRLLEAGDEALYEAKKNGKDGYALENDAPLAKPLQRIA